MIQNLVYCALVEDQMQTQVPYGLVIYAGEQVRRVEYNEANRLWLNKVIAKLRLLHDRRPSARSLKNLGLGAPVAGSNGTRLNVRAT